LPTLEVNAVTRLLHTPVPLRGRSEAEAHVGTICFKLGPPSLIGAELELLVEHRDDPSVRPALGELAEALGEHAPHSISPLSPALPLPASAPPSSPTPRCSATGSPGATSVP
jgi:hypothetical protein